MVPLSDRTSALVQRIVSEEKRAEAIKILENDCADNLPFLEEKTSEGLERFRFAALKIGKGNIKNLKKAVELAQQDWRDLLVAAAFADSVDAHNIWARQKYGI